MESVPEVTPELPTRTWQLLLAALGRLPQRGMSRAFGRIADVPIPPRFRPRLLRSFAEAVGIDLNEVENPLSEYPTLNAFFVRRLRPGVRTWPEGEGRISSPVDGILGRFGEIRGGAAIQAKGHTYTVADLLADATEARRYEGGTFVTIYLSPRHYHRIHAPCAGSIARATYVPGTLLPVNAPAVMHLPGLFVRNERVLCYVDGQRGRVAVVAVGAYNVGRISTEFDPEWGAGGAPTVSNRSSSSPPHRSYDPPMRVETGQEIMAFHLGSTIVMLLEPGVPLRPELDSGTEVRVGQPLDAD